MTVLNEVLDVEREALWSTAARLTPTLEVTTGAGLRIFVHTSDHEIGRRIFVDGAFERDTVARAHAVLAEHDGGSGLRGRTMIDIGANIGTASLHALVEFGAEVSYCFEPDPANLTLLKVNIAANGLEERMRVTGHALSDRPGVAMLELCEDNSGAHALCEAPTPGRPAIEVVTDTFDGWLAARERRPSLARAFGWIDVEGWELAVLRGASALLEPKVPLVLEYFPPALGADAAPLRDLLARHYRTWIDLRDEGASLQPIDRLDDLHDAIVAEERVLTDVLVLG